MITENKNIPKAGALPSADFRLATRCGSKNYGAFSYGSNVVLLKDAIRGNSYRPAQDAILVNRMGNADLQGAISHVADVCNDAELAELLKS